MTCCKWTLCLKTDLDDEVENKSFTCCVQKLTLIHCYFLSSIYVLIRPTWIINRLVLDKQFLADRTNGRAYATVFIIIIIIIISPSVRPSVCRLWRYVLWLNGAS